MHSLSILIYYLSFHLHGQNFWVQTFTPQNIKNTPKYLKKYPPKSEVCLFCVQSGKSYTEFFVHRPSQISGMSLSEQRSDFGTFILQSVLVISLVGNDTVKCICFLYSAPAKSTCCWYWPDSPLTI